MTETQKYPIIAIIGLDPQQHQLPPLLRHHLDKMRKDFQLTFIADVDLSVEKAEDGHCWDNTGAAIRDMVAKNAYVPTPKPAKAPLVTVETAIPSDLRSDGKLFGGHGKVIKGGVV